MDSDEDLLALAGAGGDSTEEEKPVPYNDNNKKPNNIGKRPRGASSTQKGRKRRARSASFSEDEVEFEDEEEEQEKAGGVGEEEDEEFTDEVQDEGGDSDETEDEDIFINPYPLEGKYKNEKDRDDLEGLAEIEREQILFDRSQEMQKFNERVYLAQRAKERKQAERAFQRTKERQEKAKREKPVSGKKSQLSELKKRREEKSVRSNNRAKGINVSKSHESEDEDYEEEDYEGEEEEYKESDEEVEWAKSEEPIRDITAADINKVRFGKTLLAKFVHYPNFEDVVANCFVRVNIGFNRERQTNTYRVCQVKGISKAPKPYKFLNRTVDFGLKVTHGASEKTFEMGICSDGAITEDEFRWWKNSMQQSNLLLPSARKIDKKFKELSEFQNRKLSSEEINEMIIKRQQHAASSLGANTVIEKSVLLQRRVIALENGDYEELEQIDQRLEQLDSILNKSSRQKQNELDRLAQVNLRNRKANLEGIRRAEIIAQENRRKALSDKKDVPDPFSRLRTSARIFYESRSSSATPAPEQNNNNNNNNNNHNNDSEQKSEVDKRKNVIPRKKVDDVIASIDLDIEI